MYKKGAQVKKYDFSIPDLGVPSFPSPVTLSKRFNDLVSNYVSNEDRIVYELDAAPNVPVTYTHNELIEKAGPREKIFFNPSMVRVGIVTCGGLCPGLNDVIRAIVMNLWYHYGVRSIAGIRFGYYGLLPENHVNTINLTPDFVRDIHKMGGTVLGSSRGNGDRVSNIVDSMQKLELSMLFTIGGDGTQRGACRIAQEIERRQLKIAVVGIPKTIDNDLSFIEKSFGFETAVGEAVKAVDGAHVEARAAINGVGIVKLMGRESGFIAANTALGNNDVNYVFVPEVPFDLDGEKGLLLHLRQRLQERNHAVIVIAEGAGQEHLEKSVLRDASGNKKLNDIGIFIRDSIDDYFKSEGIEVNLKYIDPSYIIRSTPANPIDSIYCTRLGANAVHAAMAGKTRVLMSLINNTFVHIPMDLAVAKRHNIDPESPLWRDVIQATGQPAVMRN
jgi:6-phosphofructokinase 1